MRALAVFGFLVVLALLVSLAVACGRSEPPPDAYTGPSDVSTYELTKEKAEDMIKFKCTVCHSDGPVKKARMTAEEWRARIDACKTKPGGAIIGTAERNALADWLARRP